MACYRYCWSAISWRGKFQVHTINTMPVLAIEGYGMLSRWEPNDEKIIRPHHWRPSHFKMPFIISEKSGDPIAKVVKPIVIVMIVVMKKFNA